MKQAAQLQETKQEEDGGRSFKKQWGIREANGRSLEAEEEREISDEDNSRRRTKLQSSEEEREDDD